MADIVDIARAERENLRWVILLTLWNARPYGANEGILMRIVRDLALHITPDQIRQEMNYLKGRKLLELQSNQPVWSASILPDGEDLVDYRADCPEGIARPAKW